MAAKRTKTATKIDASHHPENPPEWYWARGLHDAGITDVEEFEFPFDYRTFVGPKSNDNRNLLKLKIDSKGAVYDSSVKEIYFYNYEVLTPNISLKNRKVMWWLSDRLIANGDHFVLEIDLQDFNSYPEDFTFKIRFERAEVVRA